MRKFSLLVFMLFIASLSWAQEGSLDTLIDQQKVEEVTIYASRTNAKLKDLPSKIEVIPCKEIQQSGDNDVADLLKHNTSIDIIQYPNFLSGIGMRGFAPRTSTKYVTILVDGVPAGTMNMSTLTLNGVQQVEILKGPFSSLYGSSAMGGLINIVPMRNKGNLTGSASISYGSYNTLKGNIAVGGNIAGGLSFDFNAFYRTQNDDYKTGNKNILGLNTTQEAILDKNSFGVTMERTSYKTMGGNLRLGYDFNENWNVDLFGSYFSASDIVTNGSFFGVYSPNEKDMKQYRMRLSLEGRMGNHLLKVNPHFSNHFYEYTDIETNFKTSESLIKTYGVQIQDNINIGGHVLTVGIDNSNKNTEGKSYNNKDGIEKAPYKPNFKNSTVGAFGQVKLKLLDDKFNISGGFRNDFINLTLEANEFMKNEKKTEQYSKFSPNLGFKYNFVGSAFLHASYGTAFLSPDAYQKAGQYTGSRGTTKGNPDLKGEHSTTFDVGLGYRNYRQGVDFDITYFHTNHDDFIVDDDSNKGYKTFKNAKEAKMKGIELMASYDFGSLVNYAFSLKAYFNGTFMFETKVLDNDKWKDIMYVREKTINFGLQFATENKWSAKVNGRFIGSRIEKNWYKPSWYPNVRPTLATLADKTQHEYAKEGLLKHPHFMVFDANIYYNITEHFTVGVNANNIFDENYTEKDGYNMPGRNFMGTLRFNF